MTETKWRTYQDRMTVTVPEGEVDGLRVVKFEIQPNNLENLRQEIRYGRGTVPGWYTKLVDANTIENGHPRMWMSDTDAEKGDHAKAVATIQMLKASRVVINGLGLGMVLAAALTYDHVRQVDVIETDDRVIKLVGPHYTADPRVNIIHADAYDQIHAWSSGTRWDVGWSDIWPTMSSDNLPGMDRLHAFYRLRCQFHGMWGRKECLALRRELRAYGLE